MKASAVVAQIPITWDIERNLSTITAVLAGTRPDEIVVLPEAAISGYDDDLSNLDQLGTTTLAHAIDRIAEFARQRAIHLFCGSLLFEGGGWWNAALYFGPDGTRWTYRKTNLATHERGRLNAGGELPTLRLRLTGAAVTVGVQLCREIRFPEQWQHLADAGAQAFLYLNHAATPPSLAGSGVAI